MTDDFASVFGNERKGQRAGVAKCVDDQMFGLMAERMIGKRGDVDALYCGEIFFSVSGRTIILFSLTSSGQMAASMPSARCDR